MRLKINSATLALLFSVLGSVTGSGVAEELTVLKDPNCGCCEKWIAAFPKRSTFTIEHPRNLAQRKHEFGIHAEIQSCHTAVSEGGYVFEGHVPPQLVSRYLAGEKSEDGVGLTVPGMPIGSVGMEIGGRFEPYTVYEIHKNGSISPYLQVVSKTQQSALSVKIN